MLCSEPTRFATFHAIDSRLRHVPLVCVKLFLARPCIVMQVNYGKGAIVFSNSAGLPEDRADIVRYLALLRGVNVGGKNVISKDALRQCFEDLGFTASKFGPLVALHSLDR